MVKGLPILFSRRTDGKIQTWRVQVKDCRLRTISGIKDGAMVKSEWTVCKAKNEGRANATTPEIQAEKEARALWQKRIDEGYKTDENDVDEQSVFWPMKAKHYEDYSHLVAQAFEDDDPVWVQPKLDGMRCIVRSDGMWSRRGKPIYSAPHVFDALKPVLDEHDGIVFDGELYADKFATNFNKIISLAKKQNPTPNELAESAQHLQYHCYDMAFIDGKGAPYRRRLQALKQLLPKHPSILPVKTVQVYNIEHVDTWFAKWREQNYEGAMIRLNAAYQEGKRTKFLLKYKEFQEEEFEVLDVLEGEGNRSGMAGALAFKTASGRPFTAAIMGDRAFFRQLLVEQLIVQGKLATVQFQNYTPDGSPRFPCVKCIRDYE